MKIRIQSRKNNGKFPLYISAFYILLGIPFLNVSLVLTFAAVLGVFIALYSIITGKYRINRYMLIVGGLYFFGELLAIISNCPDIGRTLRYTVEKGLVLLVLYPIMSSSINTENKRYMACNLFKTGCLISALFVWIAYFTSIPISFISTAFRTQRLIFADYGPNVIARLFCIGSLIALYQAQIELGRKKLFHYAEYIVIGFATVSTISMAGIILFVSGSLVVFCMYNKGIKRFGVVKFIAILICIIICGVLAYFNVSAVRTNVDKYLYRANLNQDDISNGRLEVLKGFDEHLLKYWLLGAGYACSNYVVGRTIHFPIIAAMIEIGIFGFISVLYQYGSVTMRDFRMLWLKKKFRFYSVLSLLIIIGDMVQPNPNYLFTWFAIFIGAVRTAPDDIVDMIES